MQRKRTQSRPRVDDLRPLTTPTRVSHATNDVGRRRPSQHVAHADVQHDLHVRHDEVHASVPRRSEEMHPPPLQMSSMKVGGPTRPGQQPNRAAVLNMARRRYNVTAEAHPNNTASGAVSPRSARSSSPTINNTNTHTHDEVVGVAAARPPSRTRMYQHELEDHLDYLLAVQQQLLPPAAVEFVSRVRTALRGERRAKTGARPLPHTRMNVGAPADDVARHALVDACDAPSRELAMQSLENYLHDVELPPNLTNTHDVADDDDAAAAVAAASPSVMVAAALADLHLQPPRQRFTADVDLAWLDRAVSLGHPGAMMNVALCLREGIGGVALDLAASLTWLEQAASVGYLPAMHELGELYERGFRCNNNSNNNNTHVDDDDDDAAHDYGVSGSSVLEPDWGEAMLWYGRAADVGHAPSMLNLGKLYISAAHEGRLNGSVGAKAEEELRRKGLESVEGAASCGSEEAVRLLARLQKQSL